MSKLSQAHLHDETTAYAVVEAILWPHGPVCPRCGSLDRIGKMNGKSTRIGVYKCYACRKPFNVKVGTVFESSHIPLHKWLQAILLLCASKKGFSSHQLARTLDIQVRSAGGRTLTASIECDRPQQQLQGRAFRRFLCLRRNALTAAVLSATFSIRPAAARLSTMLARLSRLLLAS
jgi:transposase-like protein